MPLTERLYQKSNSAINVAATPPNTPSVTLSVSTTPSISITPSVTPTVSFTPTITPSISITPTPTPSLAYNYLFNVYNCLDGNCNQFLGQKVGFSYGTSLILGYYYSSGSSAVQPVDVSGGTPVFNLDDTTGYANCTSICNPPSVTPSISVSVSLTPSISISATPSISVSPTPTISVSSSQGVSVSPTPSISISPTPSISLSRTPTPTPSPSV
jgi:hypothetical protein